jgi:HlyD family secretion protein
MRTQVMPTAALEPEIHQAPPRQRPPTHVPSARSRTRLWLALLATGVVAVAGVATLLPDQVTVVHPASMSLRDDAVGTGFVTAKVLIGVGAKINGVILATHVDQGDRVRAGQILAELQNSDVEGQLRQAGHQLNAQRASLTTARATVAASQARLHASVSAVERAKAALRLADVSFERARALFEGGVVSRETFDAAETLQAVSARDVDNAEALRAAGAQQVAAAESEATATATLADVSAAGVDVQRANLAYTVVRSPVDGYVVTRDLEQGATVVPGLPIFTVADASVIWVSANIDERELGALRVGQLATITLRSDPARPIPGVVARIAQQADPVTEEVTVDVRFARAPSDVRLNETAEVAILKHEWPNALAVPTTGIVTGPQGPAVWIVRDRRLQMRAVQTGVRDKRGWTENVGGLDPADSVVMNPSVESTAPSVDVRVRTVLAHDRGR